MGKLNMACKLAVLSLVLFSLAVFAGCSGNGSANSADTGSGSFRLGFQWPEGMEAIYAPIDSKFISPDTATVLVEITGNGIDAETPLTASVSAPQTSLVINDIPAGSKIALIKALDGSSNILSQRKEAFIIRDGETEDSGDVALGVAIKADGTDLVFEPSELNISAGAVITFQNWTGNEVTITGLGSDFTLAGMTSDVQGLTIIAEEPIQPDEDAVAGIQNHAGAGCSLLLPSEVIQVAGGNEHTVVLKADGSILAWGKNGNGQLGNGLMTDSSVPVSVTGLGAGSGVSSIAGAQYHTVALKSDGSVLAWGKNGSGQLGNGLTTDSSVPVSVTGLGSGSGVSSIAGGGYHTVALKSDGSVLAWGRNANGQLGNGLTTNSSIPVSVTGLGSGSGISSITCGLYQTVALKSDGSVLAWGRNDLGQLGDGSTTQRTTPVSVTGLGSGSGVSSIACGHHYAIALKSDGSVLAWGWNTDGQFGDGSTTSSSVPVSVTGLGAGSGISSLDGGSYYTVALKSDGSVLAWGRNADGQLGDGSTDNSYVPVSVTGLGPGSGISSVTCGSYHTIALKSDGSVLIWGRNVNGQLGDGSTTSSSVPISVTGLDN